MHIVYLNCPALSNSVAGTFSFPFSFPEFESFTYGDPTAPKAGLRRLQPGDLLVFYCGLEGCGFASKPALYLMGFFEVERAGRATDFTKAELKRLLSQLPRPPSAGFRPAEGVGLSWAVQTGGVSKRTG